MKALSHLFSTIRGSVGGITYLSNQYHQIVARQRTSPVNPMTNRQSQIRGAFSDASVLFESLSAADKQGWSDYAATLEYQGPLGPYTVPGRQVCISNVATALYLDDRGLYPGTPDATPPLAPGFLSLADLDVQPLTLAGIGFEVVARNNNPEQVIGFGLRSFAFPSTRNRFKGPWLTETAHAIVIAPDDSGQLPFDGLNLDSVYFANIRFISDEPPLRISQLYIIRAIATETTIP